MKYNATYETMLVLYTTIYSLIYVIPQTLCLLNLGMRITIHTQPLNALEGVICEGDLEASANIQPLDALEVCKHCTS